MRILACLVLLTVPAPAPGQPRALPPDGPGWTLRGDVRVARVTGVPAFLMRSGAAYYHDVAVEDGTIAFDLAPTRRRSFVGLRFRASSEGRFEEIYFRPHKSGLPDAVQYAPAFTGGRSQWQLYHGPGASAPAVFVPQQWTRVRVVVSGRRAAVFLGDAAEPVLTVDRLAHDPAPGFVGLWSFDDGAVAPGEQVTAVANVTVHAGLVQHTFAPAKATPPPPGLVRHWEVSAPFVAPAGAVLSLPEAIVAGPWTPAETEPDGLLPFDRVVAPPPGARRATVLARFVLRAERAGMRRLNIGFSDDVSVFVGGVPIYSGVNGYSYNFPRRDGLITIDQASLYLPLREGDNVVVLAVSDTFGGWGVMAQAVADGEASRER